MLLATFCDPARQRTLFENDRTRRRQGSLKQAEKFDGSLPFLPYGCFLSDSKKQDDVWDWAVRSCYNGVAKTPRAKSGYDLAHRVIFIQKVEDYLEGVVIALRMDLMRRTSSRRRCSQGFS